MRAKRAENFGHGGDQCSGGGGPMIFMMGGGTGLDGGGEGHDGGGSPPIFDNPDNL